MELNISTHKQNTKEWWDERYSKSSDYLYSKEPSAFVMENLDLLPPQAKILEVACGEGRNTVALALKNYQVLGLDFSKVALERAQKLADGSNAKLQLKAVDLDLYIPELLTFDAIVSVDFKLPITLLKNLSRGLKQNGFLFLEAPLLASMKSNSKLEAFECYKPNELLQALNPASMQFQIQFYSEMGPGIWGQKTFLIAKKAQLL